MEKYRRSHFNSKMGFSYRLQLFELNSDYKIDRILVARLNNDAIESFFSELRFINGWLKGITYLMFWAALRMIILGRDTPSLKQNVNSRDKSIVHRN